MKQHVSEADSGLSSFHIDGHWPDESWEYSDRTLCFWKRLGLRIWSWIVAEDFHAPDLPALVSKTLIAGWSLCWKEARAFLNAIGVQNGLNKGLICIARQWIEHPDNFEFSILQYWLQGLKGSSCILSANRGSTSSIRTPWKRGPRFHGLAVYASFKVVESKLSKMRIEVKCSVVRSFILMTTAFKR